jgi:hypothetical protein
MFYLPSIGWFSCLPYIEYVSPLSWKYHFHFIFLSFFHVEFSCHFQVDALDSGNWYVLKKYFSDVCSSVWPLMVLYGAAEACSHHDRCHDHAFLSFRPKGREDSTSDYSLHRTRLMETLRLIVFGVSINLWDPHTHCWSLCLKYVGPPIYFTYVHLFRISWRRYHLSNMLKYPALIKLGHFVELNEIIKYPRHGWSWHEKRMDLASASSESTCIRMLISSNLTSSLMISMVSSDFYSFLKLPVRFYFQNILV